MPIFPRSSDGARGDADSRITGEGDERPNAPAGLYPRRFHRIRSASQGMTAALNIRYDPPILAQHLQRMQRSQLSHSHQRIPSGYPTGLTGELVWSGQGQGLSDEAIYVTLDASDVRQITAAVKSIRDTGLGFDSINSTTFVLSPSLNNLFDLLRRQLHSGLGFFVLRGLNVSHWQDEDRLRAFLGVSSYIASEVGWQNQMGFKNLHVTNVKTGKDRQPLYSDAAMPFHTDVMCSVLAMFYINVAEAGGELLLASAWKVYNELAAKYPRMISLLSSRDWPLQDTGEDPSYHKRALLHLTPEKRVVLNFSRRLLTGSEADPRSDNVPSLSEEQYDTLNELHHCAMKHSLALRLQPGDMVFINNFAIMHGRNEFKDSDQSKRHAIRLWLNDPGSGWGPIPPGLAADWMPVFGANSVQGNWRPKPPTTPNDVSTGSTKCG